MFRDRHIRAAAPVIAGLVWLAGMFAASAQERRPANRIDVQDYTIDADITPNTSSLAARTTVRFIPLDDGVSSASFELNNALNVSKVVDAAGKEIPASRTQQDYTIRLTFDPALPKGQPYSVTFYYDGKLSGQEDSPVYGVKFAALHPDFGFLLYPSRWIPVNGYTTDRFGADLKVTVPMGYSVLGSGFDTHQQTGDKNQYEIKMDKHSFPASFAVVKEQPVKVQQDGVTTSLYFRGQDASMAQAYGEEIGRQMAFFTGMYGLPPYANLTVVETEDGAPGGYAAPGLIFLSPRSIGKTVNARLVANQISRQWWEEMLSPTTRNHLWLENGLATYSELLWVEHSGGQGPFDSALQQEMVSALTIDNVPIMQSARLEDYSPELWALTGSKGAAVLSMLRNTLGDEKFFKVLKDFAQENVWKSVNTDTFKDVVQKDSGQDLGYFFIQWIESSGAPEFHLDYTIYRTQKGFRVMGKISQDLDTFRMPVDLKIETEGNPETKRVEVVGTASEFSVDTFGKPKSVTIDPNNRVLRYSPQIRVAVAIKRGEQFAELSDFSEALKEYRKALETQKNSSLAYYRIAEVELLQSMWQQAANDFREALNGDQTPQWTVVWAHINLGKIFDVTGQRDRAVNEYNQAIRTKDDTQGAQEEAAKYLKTPYQREKKSEQ
jgi:hypothetical protein